MLLSLVSLAAGLVLLIKGADWLVDGGSSLAKRLKISDLVIGLTIVSFGTSAPELLVNIIASFQGSTDIAIGNIVGSNIANTLLILGAAAIVAPLAVQRSTVFKEIPFCLLASVTLMVMANDAIVDGYVYSELSRSDGLAFLGFFIIFIYYTFGIRHHHGSEEKKFSKAKMSILKALGLVTVGCVGLALGGNLTVIGAKDIALTIGVSEALVGITIVAVGTSLPELVTSVIAAMKGNTDIAVGNVVGSNIFNIFWILGLSASIRPLNFQPSINADLLMVIVSILLLLVFVHTGRVRDRLFFWWRHRDGHMIARWEGIVMLLLYFTYIGFVTWRG